MSNIIDSIQLSGVTYAIQGSGGVPESAFTAYTAATDSRIAEDEEVTAAGLNALNSAISGISGNNVVELTQAQYDALVTGGTVDPTAFYIITDATPADLSQYWTSAQTQSAINQATAAKQDTLVSGTNIKTINNESLLGSGNIDIQGGSTYTAGRGISIANDTISVSLPISAGTGSNSLVVGGSTTANGINSFAGGDNANASGNWSFAFGKAQATNNYTFAANGGSKATKGYSAAFNTSEANNTYAFSCGTSKSNGYASFASGWDNKSLNNYESSFGYYNVSSSASTTFGDSGNTLFSVGNGTSSNARHNAFEIRQNGDIYLSSGGTDIKLQDHLGGGGGTVDQTIISGSTNAVAGGAVYSKIDEVEQVTAAALNDLNDTIGNINTILESI